MLFAGGCVLDGWALGSLFWCLLFLPPRCAPPAALLGGPGGPEHLPGGPGRAAPQDRAEVQRLHGPALWPGCVRGIHRWQHACALTHTSTKGCSAVAFKLQSSFMALFRCIVPARLDSALCFRACFDEATSGTWFLLFTTLFYT